MPTYPSNARAEADRWLQESFERHEVEAARECLATAAVYALLAVADQLDRIDSAVRLS